MTDGKGATAQMHAFSQNNEAPRKASICEFQSMYQVGPWSRLGLALL